MAAEWSRIAPHCPAREVEAQRKRVLELRGQIAKRREERDAAAARVLELEKADRERMARLMAAGEPATSEVEKIEQARADAAGAVRALEALNLAIAGAEGELHGVILKPRGPWVKAAQRNVTESRSEAQDALEAFRSALERYRGAQQVELWLRDGSGVDREQAPRTAVLGHAPGSDRVTANRSDVDIGNVFTWLAAALEPPRAPRETPVQPLEPVQFGIFAGER
jgi:hypothetical protein